MGYYQPPGARLRFSLLRALVAALLVLAAVAVARQIEPGRGSAGAHRPVQ